MPPHSKQVARDRDSPGPWSQQQLLIPVHRLIMPVMLSDGGSSGHMGAPYNCLQRLHKVLAESTLQGRNGARVIGTITGATALPCGRRQEWELVGVQDDVAEPRELHTRLPALQDPVHT